MPKNILREQQDLITRLQQVPNLRKEPLRVEWDEARGTAARLRGSLDPDGIEQDEDKSRQRFFDEFAHLLGPADLAKNVRRHRHRTDRLGFKRADYQQYHRPADGKAREAVAALRARAERIPRAVATPDAAASAGDADTLAVYGARLVLQFDSKKRALALAQSSCWRDIKTAGVPRVDPSRIQKMLLADIRGLPGFDVIAGAARRAKQKSFPLADRPRLVIYPWKREFRWAWAAFGYAGTEVGRGRAKGRRIRFGHVFVDAATGELLHFAPTRTCVEEPASGTGLGVTPLGGPYSVRGLNVVRVDGGDLYRLRDTTLAREIIVFDAAGNSSMPPEAFPAPIADGTLPVSEDVGATANWDLLASGSTDPERAASQQPEVDAHYHTRLLYQWYDAIAGGRAGWDDGRFSTVPALPLRVATHVYDLEAGSSRSMLAFHELKQWNGAWYAYLVFGDGNPGQSCSSAGDRAFDYLAGSRTVLAHEYHHGITQFSFHDDEGNPGLVNSGWYAALHEGLSDAFAGLFAEDWRIGRDVSSANLPIRDLVYPTNMQTFGNLAWGGGGACGIGGFNKDHFFDRNNDGADAYDRGTIIGHCAFLLGAGGVQQRLNRAPNLIPVQGLGREIVGGVDTLKAARIFYRALDQYLGNAGAPTGLPADDETIFHRLRDGCVDASIDLYGLGSREHRTTELAFYAVGLQPSEASYGADITFLRWGNDWRLSRDYLGLSCPTWSSLDLFINNGGSSEWNAQINVLVDGVATTFENTVYCRVRNVGTEAASSVHVEFFYAKMGTAAVVWVPMLDKDGVAQVLDIDSLGAGAMTIDEDEQDSPPAEASVRWFIAPLAEGEEVDHFCIKAIATAANDVNPWNNEVQSNLAYVPYAAGESMDASFMVANDRNAAVPIEVTVSGALPAQARADLFGWKKGAKLERGAAQKGRLRLSLPARASRALSPPFDGRIAGRLGGPVGRGFTGTLTSTRWDEERLTGMVALRLDDGSHFVGRFDGKVDRERAAIEGEVVGFRRSAKILTRDEKRAPITARLRPDRFIDVSHKVGREEIGGFTIRLQDDPPPRAPDAWRRTPPPTVRVVPAARPPRRRRPK